ncbi:MAG: preprotein translocase subunit SecE [Parachlamydia sp.]|nr:preprotein translocase subunit SecE [Parachlamydia sp.]
MVTEVKPMEVKKTQQVASPVATSREAASREAALRKWKPKEFVGEIKEELKKISWTSPEELKAYTQIVVGATFFCGMGIYLIDLLIQFCLNGLALIARLITG